MKLKLPRRVLEIGQESPGRYSPGLIEAGGTAGTSRGGSLLPVGERRLALRKAQAEGLHPAFLLEKDIWVVATLNVRFAAPFGRDLVFKAGTSLSKAWQVIRRFSEDIDITYDIRSSAPDLVEGGGEEALPNAKPGEALDEGDRSPSR